MPVQESVPFWVLNVLLTWLQSLSLESLSFLHHLSLKILSPKILAGEEVPYLSDWPSSSHAPLEQELCSLHFCVTAKCSFKIPSESIHLYHTQTFFGKNIFPLYRKAALYQFDLRMKNDSRSMLFRKSSKLFFVAPQMGDALMKVLYN